MFPKCGGKSISSGARRQGTEIQLSDFLVEGPWKIFLFLKKSVWRAYQGDLMGLVCPVTFLCFLSRFLTSHLLFSPCSGASMSTTVTLSPWLSNWQIRGCTYLTFWQHFSVYFSIFDLSPCFLGHHLLPLLITVFHYHISHPFLIHLTLSGWDVTHHLSLMTFQSLFLGLFFWIPESSLPLPPELLQAHMSHSELIAFDPAWSQQGPWSSWTRSVELARCLVQESSGLLTPSLALGPVSRFSQPFILLFFCFGSAWPWDVVPSHLTRGMARSFPRW